MLIVGVCVGRGGRVYGMEHTDRCVGVLYVFAKDAILLRQFHIGDTV